MDYQDNYPGGNCIVCDRGENWIEAEWRTICLCSDKCSEKWLRKMLNGWHKKHPPTHPVAHALERLLQALDDDRKLREGLGDVADFGG